MINAPRKIILCRDALARIPKLISQLKLEFPIALIAGEYTRRFASKLLQELDHSQIKLFVFNQQPIQALDQALQSIPRSTGCILGLGGGRIIDLAKLLGSRLKIPVISAPTNASHDGIASPRANLIRGYPSIPVDPPVAVVADLELICSSPTRYLISGAGDLISNYTACLDWQLAHSELGEEIHPRAYSISMECAQRMMELAESEIFLDKFRFVKELTIKLVDSGIAMCLAGSSRPASGSEHKFSHALDRILDQPRLHGEQCGLGTIIMSYLHGADWERVRQSLAKLGAPITASQLGISRKQLIDALSMAHEINPERYTILRDGIPRERWMEIVSKLKMA